MSNENEENEMKSENNGEMIMKYWKKYEEKWIVMKAKIMKA